MKIRKAVLSDAQVVAGLVLALMDELSGSEPSGYTADGLSELASALLGSNDLAALLAEQDGVAVGVIVLNGCASLYAGRFGEITEMYVKPAFRSSGAGEALIFAASEIGRECGWSRLEVGTPDQPAWKRTLEFYKRHGFIETGVRLKLPL